MSIKKPAPLPASLSYLQPFVNKLTKLPPEDLNEDIDASRLDAALRKRISGLDVETATLALDSDRKELHDWLSTRRDHPAHWVLGYISLPTIAEQLLCPPEAIDPGPTITFDAPLGWKKTGDFPSRSDFKKGKVYMTITALDELAHESLMNSFEFKLTQVEVPGIEQPRRESSCDRFDVVFGECRGRKYCYHMTAPAHWKQVDYMLCVPGGYISVWLGTMTGVDFDEGPVEAKLHTLRLS